MTLARGWNDCFIPKMIFTGRHAARKRAARASPLLTPSAAVSSFSPTPCPLLPQLASEAARALLFFSKRNTVRFTLKIHRRAGIMQLNASTSEREKREGRNEQNERRPGVGGCSGGGWESIVAMNDAKQRLLHKRQLQIPGVFGGAVLKFSWGLEWAFLCWNEVDRGSS